MGDWQSCKGVLVVFLNVFIGFGSQLLWAEEAKKMSLLNEIEPIMELYLTTDDTPIEFLDLIADNIDDTFEESGSLSFQPKLHALKKSYLRFDRKSNAFEYLELNISPDSDLRLKELQDRWGEPQTLIRAPSQPYPRVIFPVFKESNFPFAGRVTAYVRGGAKNPDSKIIQIQLKRMSMSTTSEELLKGTLETRREKDIENNKSGGVLNN